MGALRPMTAPVPGANGVWRGAVDVAGGLVRLTVAGEGAPVVLLHGWTLDHRMWQPQIAALARDFMLIMPDRRGFGRSSAPPDLPREAEDIARIADYLKLDRFALLGLSQGASVALDFAVRAPTRLDAVIACGAPLPALVEREEALDLGAYALLARAGRLAALRSDWAAHPLMQTRSPAARAMLRVMLAEYDARDLLSPSSLPELAPTNAAGLAMPVLAIAGAADTPWRRACAAALAKAAPQGALALVEGAGHVANLDNPAEFNRVVGDFLRQTPAQTPARTPQS